MGLSMGMSSCDTCEPKRLQPNPNPNPNPNPKNFSLIRVYIENNLAIVEAEYPDCTNFEGKKIMVFPESSLLKIEHRAELDPHFCENCDLGLIARFAPTAAGWRHALRFVKTL